MSDDFDQALAEAIDATGSHRYVWLCSEANTLPSPNSRDDWRRWIVEGRWRPVLRPVEDVLAEARAEGIPEAIPSTKPCGGCPG